MLSHGNLVSNSWLPEVHPGPAPVRGDGCLSFLPLSHIFERTGGHYAMFHAGRRHLLRGEPITMPQNLLEVRPAVLMAVPRIYEKIYAKVRDAVSSGGLTKRLVFHWAMAPGHRVVRLLYQERAPGWPEPGLALADRILLPSPGSAPAAGCASASRGGAALNPQIMEFFWAVGVPIFEGYGLTETSPILTLNRLGRGAPGLRGPTHLKTWNGRPFLKLAEDGEILCQGPNVMLGYWKQEAATREVFDADGYFRTGDVGAHGPPGPAQDHRPQEGDHRHQRRQERGPPAPRERAAGGPYIEQAIVVGRPAQPPGRAHRAPLPRPARMVRAQGPEVLRRRGDGCAPARVVAKLMTRVNHVNARLPAYERIRRVALLPQELTPASGLLTPSLKLKRREVNEAFKDTIEGLYRSSA